MNTTFADLKRLPVIDASGDHLGHVVDLQFDPDDWLVGALVVRLERHAAERLGVKRFLVPSLLDLKVIHVHAVGDAVLLRETLDELSKEVNTSGTAQVPP